MNDEEKKAIETLKYLKNSKWYSHAFDRGTDIFDEDEKKEIDIVLNLIEKQDKEIEKLKTKNSDLLRKLRNRVKDVKKLQKYGAYKKEFSNLNKRIEKQEKIINEMAEMLVKDHDWFYSEFNNYTAEDFIEYFTKKVGE